MTSNHYSELQVVPNAALPELVQYQSLPEVVQVPQDKYIYAGHPQTGAYNGGYNGGYNGPVGGEPYGVPDPSSAALSVEKPRRICGLAPKTFWIALVIGALVVIGAVVGGVVGAITSKNNSNSGSTASQTTSSTITTTTSVSSSGTEASAISSSDASSSSTTPTSTKTTSVSITTSTLIGPSQTLFRDCPSSNFTIYQALDGSTVYQFRKFCGTNIAMSNTFNIVNRKASSANACIDLCAAYNVSNKTEIAAGNSPRCNAVCWRHQLTSDLPGQCFGFTTQNSSTSGFQFNAKATECDTAGWINQT
jgi:hypothetical protein